MNEDILDIEISILEKLNIFENAILEKRKEEGKEFLLLDRVPFNYQLIYLLNHILFGISLGRLVSTFFIPEVKTNLFYGIFLVITSVVSSRYIYAYLNKGKNKTKIKNEIEATESLKELKECFLGLKKNVNYNNLVLNENNLEMVLFNNHHIDNEEMKGLINELTTQELEFIMDVLKKNSQKNSFSLNLITDIKKLCQKNNNNKRKEKILLNNLKEIKGSNIDTVEKDDFLQEMLEQCNIKDLSKEKIKINFKKNL